MTKFLPIIAAFLFLLLGMPLVGTSQVVHTVELNTETVTSDQGDEIVVFFTVNKFEEIAAMQFSINWLPDFLEFKSVDNFTLPDFTLASLNTASASTGEIAVVWFHSRATGVTLPDGAILFSITFTKLSEVPTEIYLDDTPTAIEFSQPGRVVNVNSSTIDIVKPDYLLTGSVLVDSDKNCEIAAGEKGIKGWLVEVEGERAKRFLVTNENGDFETYLPFGDYTIKTVAAPNSYYAICEPEQTFSIENGTSTPVNIAFTAQAILDCPSLSVEMATPFLRRCFENNYTVNYCNNGTIAAEGTFILVELDPFFTFIESSIPFTLVSENNYRFDIGSVDFNECGNFNIKVKVDCDNTELGQTHCVNARIFPDIICQPPSDNWSGASLSLKSECVGDKVELSIENIGEGNMQKAQQFIVIQDMIMLNDQTKSSSIQLQSGQKEILSFDADGSTYRLEAKQVPFHPIEATLATAIEGCGTNEAGTFTKGVVNMFSLGDDSQFGDTDCQENRGAYDPNDKNAFPAGYRAAHYIDQNTDLTYHIRFQNTGTDTAFNIVVLDTISDLLDVSTIIPLVSSHPYEFEVVDSNILKFSFNNIMLPDSFINEPASNGFFKYEIKQQPDVELGSIIENSAAIYFDFNPPVITNTYAHTVGTDFIEFRVITSTHDFSPISMEISPNPMRQTATIRIDNAKHSAGQFLLYDLHGRRVGTYPFFGNEFQLQRGDLAAGMYLFEVQSEGQLLGNGKLMIK